MYLLVFEALVNHTLKWPREDIYIYMYIKPSYGMKTVSGRQDLGYI